MQYKLKERLLKFESKLLEAVCKHMVGALECGFLIALAKKWGPKSTKHAFVEQFKSYQLIRLRL